MTYSIRHLPVAVLCACILWPIIFVLRTLLIILGLPVVAIALSFAYQVGGPKQFTQYPGEWRLIRLPKWAFPWDNPADGAMGDTRGWYWNEGHPAIFKSSYWKAWYWMAIRNPANNFSRYTRGVSAYMPDVLVHLLAGQTYVRDKIGDEGWQFVGGEGKHFIYCGFYGVWRYGKTNKGLVIRLGHKIEPRHNQEDWAKEEPHKQWKGMTFKINPVKDIS